jgi:hypothetical protein
MATLAAGPTPGSRSDDGFFLTMAFVIAGIVFVSFLQFHLRGLSSFNVPLLIHAHAVIFMGWMVIYLLQNWFATRGPIALHRRLGWLALAWLFLMIVVGPATTIYDVRTGRVPFFFQPLHMLLFDPMSIIGATALFIAGVAMRRQTDWHRRLNYCGMALLTGPAFGRVLPMPLLIPWAYHATFLCVLMLPVIGIIADLRRDGRVHPAWAWGIGAMFATELVIDAIAFTPIGLALYQVVTAGSPGADIAPLAFPPSPLG